MHAYDQPVKVHVLDHAKVPTAIRDAVREALLAEEVEFNLQTELGGNPFQNVVDADAVVAIDSNLDRVEAMRFGWAARASPLIVVKDDTGSPINKQSTDSDRRWVVYNEFDSGDFVDSLRRTVRSLIEDPKEFASYLVRPTQQSELDVPSRTEVFLSYSHVDRAYVQQLVVHLAPLQNDGRVVFWSDNEIRPGEDWKAEIRDALGRAGIAVLLISPDFLASSFIVNHELPPLLVAAKEGGTRILPVVIRPCRFTRDAELSRFQAFNNAEPLAGLSAVQQDAAWDEVAAEIERTVKSPAE